MRMALVLIALIALTAPGQGAVAGDQVTQSIFTTRHGITDWTTLKKLISNPYKHEGHMVGIGPLSFIQMVSSNQAIFQDSAGTPALFGSIATAEFENGDTAVLAVKVKGQDANGPIIETWGVYICANPACTEFLGR